jgi:hypothetical protein
MRHVFTSVVSVSAARGAASAQTASEHLLLQHTAAVQGDIVVGGYLPTAQKRLVDAWVEIHRDELRADWTLLQSGQSPVKIDPLR